MGWQLLIYIGVIVIVVLFFFRNMFTHFGSRPISEYFNPVNRGYSGVDAVWVTYDENQGDIYAIRKVWYGITVFMRYGTADDYYRWGGK